ncbi:MAG: hypothetical protein C00003105_00774 [ANME-2 cluster archaeon HR1]|jgi:Zn finger protein HypA/HybF involved in hydrogenase expression|nr:Zn finger protein [ANME-2 cluster archaeon]PPA78610.1 MAG: hypothetical protein C00003105_00774 [ANME-2 cluster archaeon HR1]
MCSVGDGFGVDIQDVLEPKNYECNDCGNKFQGIGKKVTCPACQSNSVKLA